MRETPDVVLRGVLQPRYSFVVPNSVSILRVEDARQCRWIPRGIGDDGITYLSTGIFPQSARGGIVQVLDIRRSVLGLSEDGVVYEVGADTRGAAIEWPRMKKVARFVSIARVSHPHRGPELILIARDGVFYEAIGRDESRRARIQAPAGVHARAIWNDDKGRLVIECARSVRRVWRPSKRGFVVDVSVTVAGRPFSARSRKRRSADRRRAALIV